MNKEPESRDSESRVTVYTSGSSKKNTGASTDRQDYDIPEDYAVHSRIANSRSMQNPEGYPSIAKTIFDTSYPEPDACEYSVQQRRNKKPYDD